MGQISPQFLKFLHHFRSHFGAGFRTKKLGRIPVHLTVLFNGAGIRTRILGRIPGLKLGPDLDALGPTPVEFWDRNPAPFFGPESGPQIGTGFNASGLYWDPRSNAQVHNFSSQTAFPNGAVCEAHWSHQQRTLFSCVHSGDGIKLCETIVTNSCVSRGPPSFWGRQAA